MALISRQAHGFTRTNKKLAKEGLFVLALNVQYFLKCDLFFKMFKDFNAVHVYQGFVIML